MTFSARRRSPRVTSCRLVSLHGDGDREDPPKPPTAATPWGAAALLEEATIAQRVGDKRFAVVVQLLEAPGGERLIRFAYTTDGTARRGPVTMRARDLERLRRRSSVRPCSGRRSCA